MYEVQEATHQVKLRALEGYPAQKSLQGSEDIKWELLVRTKQKNIIPNEVFFTFRQISDILQKATRKICVSGKT